MQAPYVHRLRVRYGECDPQGIVFNANYFSYFDVCLTELWREAAGSYAQMTERGTDMVVAEASARFFNPAGFDDQLEIELSISRLGTTSMTTALRVLKDKTVVCEGTMRHVFIDLQTRAKTEIPQWLRAALEPYVLEPQVSAAS